MKPTHSLGAFNQKDMKSSKRAKAEPKKPSPPELKYQLGPFAPDDKIAQARFAIAKRLIAKNGCLTSLTLADGLRTDRNKASSMISQWRKIGWLVREGEAYERPEPRAGYAEVCALIRDHGSASAAQIYTILEDFGLGLSGSSKWMSFHLHAGYLTQPKRGFYAVPSPTEGGAP